MNEGPSATLLAEKIFSGCTYSSILRVAREHYIQRNQGSNQFFYEIDSESGPFKFSITVANDCLICKMESTVQESSLHRSNSSTTVLENIFNDSLNRLHFFLRKLVTTSLRMKLTRMLLQIFNKN